MSNRDKNLRKVLYGIIVIYVVTACYSFYINWTTGDMEAVGMGVLALITPFLIPLIFKIFRLKPVYELYIISTVFMYFASLVGSTMHGYSIFGFDKVLHTSSGVFIAIGAMVLFLAIKKVHTITDKQDYIIMLLFVFSFNLAAAAIWEFFEYAMLVFFNNDGINHYSQGVHDSMQDMLVACLGCLYVLFCIVRHYQYAKTGFVMHLIESFSEKNIKIETKEQKSVE